MNYKSIYESLISKARERSLVDGYSEKHHVIPKCMGGSNERSNLVVLTAEEHFLAHQLLVKINPGNSKLTFALDKMTLEHNSKKRNNKMYGWIRRRVNKSLSERMKNSNPMNSKESRIKLSNSKKGKNTGAEHQHATGVVCVQTGQVFETRAAAGAWLRSIGHLKAHGGSLSEALKDSSKYSSFGFNWKYA